MKQYTTPDQTAKLIELGFEKPKSVLLYAQSVDCDNNYGWRGEAKYNCDYSIGELIEMLPQVIEFGEKWVFYPLRVMSTVGGGWTVSYCNEYDERNNELIDALYDMIVRLKEKGVI